MAIIVINILVVGPQGSGKNTFIQNLAYDTKPRRRRKTDSHGFAEFKVDDNLLIHFYESVPIEKQDLWEIQAEFMTAFVLVVDMTKPDSFAEARATRDGFLKWADVPCYVIAANRYDAPGAVSVAALRNTLGAADSIKIFPCNVTDREGDKQIMIELLREVP